jgi:uncharacterized protein YecE (DUF72 family)
VGRGHAEKFRLRRHHGRNNGDYAPDQIRQDARLINYLDRGTPVFVYYNNDLEAYAVKNAKELLESIYEI